jgi:hypothetical protein
LNSGLQVRHTRILEMGTICQGWSHTAILLISAFQVARITGVNHQHLAEPAFPVGDPNISICGSVSLKRVPPLTGEHILAASSEKQEGVVLPGTQPTEPPSCPGFSVQPEESCRQVQGLLQGPRSMVGN